MTKVEFHFLGHFKAGVRHRVAWARGHVDVPDGDQRRMQLVLDDGVTHYSGSLGDCYKVPLGVAYLYEGHYWTIAEATNDHRRPLGGSFQEYGVVEGEGQKDLRNFSQLQQRRFAFDAFGLSMLERTPDGHCFNTHANDARGYKATINRKGAVVWDDTLKIEESVADYLRSNMMVVDRTVYCRIEKPCFDTTARRTQWGARRPPRRIFTPYGGHGDMVMDFEKAAITGEEYRRRVGWSTERDRAREIVFDMPEGDRRDPLARRMRAVFTELFRYDGWLDAQETQTRARNVKRLDKLYGLWLSNRKTMEDDAMDDFADTILPMTEPGYVRDAVEAWLDRPIMAPAATHGP
jgi:hypothetical protein|nr:hypothetical protein [Neorhizobium tomejilense]